jgi:hypothetical protein
MMMMTIQIQDTAILSYEVVAVSRFVGYGLSPSHAVRCGRRLELGVRRSDRNDPHR